MKKVNSKQTPTKYHRLREITRQGDKSFTNIQIVFILIIGLVIIFYARPVKAETGSTSSTSFTSPTSSTTTPNAITTSTSPAENPGDLAATTSTTSTIPIFTPTTTPTSTPNTSTATTSTPTTSTINTSTSNLDDLESLEISLQVETFDNTLYNDNFTVIACLESPSSTNYTLNAWCAIQQLAEEKNWALNYGWGQYGVFLSAIDQYDGLDWSWWSWFSDLEMGMTSLNNKILTKNEHLLLTYGVNPLKIEINTTTPLLNTTTSIKITEFGFDTNWNTVWTTSTSSTLIINDQINILTDGTYDLYINTTTNYNIYAQKQGFVKTDTITLQPEDIQGLEPISIELRIEFPTSTISSSTIKIPANCAVVDSQKNTSTFSGYKAICALQTAQEQELINYQTSDWGWGFSLDSINGLANASDWSQTWIIRINNNSAMAGIDGLTLNNDDELLFTYGSWPMEPMQILSPTTTNLNEQINLQAQVWDDINHEFINFNSTSTFWIDENSYNAPTGTLSWTASTTEDATIWVEAPGKTRSKKINLAVINENDNDDDTDTGSNGSNNGGSNLTQTLVSNNQIQQTVNKILDYLKSQQDDDGKIIGGNVADWVAWSFVANEQYPDNIKKGNSSLLDYIKSYDLKDPSEINKCVSYSRHILTLYSAGISANDDLIQNLLTKIKSNECYTNNDYGAIGINDDIFTLFALLVVGEDVNQSIIQDIVSDIKGDQTEQGAFTFNGWSGPDMTGATINTLKYAQSKGINVDEQVFSKAKQYLKSEQKSDGGWAGFGEVSEPATTAWAMIGINALGENQNDWFKENKNPWHVLTEQINEQGYYEPSWAPGTVDWFAMKYAVPALLGSTWPIEPLPVQNDDSAAPVATGGGMGGYYPDSVPSTTDNGITAATSTPTSTLDMEIATTTLNTSTLEHFNTSTQQQVMSSRADPDIRMSGEVEGSVEVKTVAKENFSNPKKQSDSEKNIKPINQLTNKQTLSAGPQKNKEQLANQVIDKLPLDTPTRRAAKKALAVSGGGALALGLYLGLRLLKNVV